MTLTCVPEFTFLPRKGLCCELKTHERAGPSGNTSIISITQEAEVQGLSKIHSENIREKSAEDVCSWPSPVFNLDQKEKKKAKN